MAHVGVDARRVGPIGLDRDDREAVPLDQAARDRRAGAIEFGGAVGRFAEQHHLGVGEAVEESAEILGALGRGHRLAKALDGLRGFMSPGGSGALGDARIGHGALSDADSPLRQHRQSNRLRAFVVPSLGRHAMSAWGRGPPWGTSDSNERSLCIPFNLRRRQWPTKIAWKGR